MKIPALSAPRVSVGAFSSVGRFWRARNQRERRILALGMVLLLAVLLWLLLIEPALDARARWEKELPVMRNQLAQMRALANEISSLPARSSNAPAAELSRQAVERSLTAKELKAQSLSVTGDGLSASFSDVSFSALTEWLQQWQSSAQLAVTDANVSARDRLGRVDARITLQRVP